MFRWERETGAGRKAGSALRTEHALLASGPQAQPEGVQQAMSQWLISGLLYPLLRKGGLIRRVGQFGFASAASL